MEFLKQLQSSYSSGDTTFEISGLPAGLPWGYLWLGIAIAILLYLVYAHFQDWYNYDISRGLNKTQALLKTGFQMIGAYVVLSPWWLTGLIWLYAVLVFHGERVVTSIQWDVDRQKVELTDNYYRTYSYPFSELSHIQYSIPSRDKEVLDNPNVFYSRMQNDDTVSIELFTKGHETFTLAKFPESEMESKKSDSASDEEEDIVSDTSLKKFAKIFSIPLYSYAEREKFYSDVYFGKLLEDRGLKNLADVNIPAESNSGIDPDRESEFIIEKRDFRRGFGLVFSYVGNLFNIAVLVFLPLFSWMIYHLTHVFERFKTFWVRKLFGKIFPKLDKEYNKKDFWKSRFFIIMNLILFFLAFGFIQSQDRARLLPAKITFSEPWFVYQQLEPGKDFNPEELTSVDFLVDVYLADPFQAWDRLRDLANLDFEKYQISYHNIETLYRPAFWQGENQISIKELQAKDRYILFWDGFDPLMSQYLLYRIESRMDKKKIESKWSDR